MLGPWSVSPFANIVRFISSKNIDLDIKAGLRAHGGSRQRWRRAENQPASMVCFFFYSKRFSAVLKMEMGMKKVGISGSAELFCTRKKS